MIRFRWLTGNTGCHSRAAGIARYIRAYIETLITMRFYCKCELLTSILVQNETSPLIIDRLLRSLLGEPVLRSDQIMTSSHGE